MSSGKWIFSLCSLLFPPAINEKREQNIGRVKRVSLFLLIPSPSGSGAGSIRLSVLPFCPKHVIQKVWTCSREDGRFTGHASDLTRRIIALGCSRIVSAPLPCLSTPPLERGHVALGERTFLSSLHGTASSAAGVPSAALLLPAGDVQWMVVNEFCGFLCKIFRISQLKEYQERIHVSRTWKVPGRTRFP